MHMIRVTINAAIREAKYVIPERNISSSDDIGEGDLGVNVDDDKNWWKKTVEKKLWKKGDENICHIPFAELSILDVLLALSIPWWWALWKKIIVSAHTLACKALNQYPKIDLIR